MASVGGMEDFSKRVKKSDLYFIEAAKLDFALELTKFMERSSISKSDLADRLGVSKPMVTKLLRGDANLTIETMVRAARKIGGNLFLRVVPQDYTPKLFQIAQASAITKPSAQAAGATRVSHERACGWSIPANDSDMRDAVDEAQPLAA